MNISPSAVAGTAIFGPLGGLYGAYADSQTQKVGNMQKTALDQAIAASTAGGQKQQQFHAGQERLGQSYVSPMDDLYRHFYGQEAPGVQTQGQQGQAETIRRDLANGGEPTAMRGTPPPAGTMAAPKGPPVPGQPGWYGTAAKPQGSR